MKKYLSTHTGFEIDATLNHVKYVLGGSKCILIGKGAKTSVFSDTGTEIKANPTPTTTRLQFTKSYLANDFSLGDFIVLSNSSHADNDGVYEIIKKNPPDLTDKRIEINAKLDLTGTTDIEIYTNVIVVNKYGNLLSTRQKGSLTQKSFNFEPPNPKKGSSVQWISNGDGAGEEGDIMMKINVNDVVKTVTLVDYSTKLLGDALTNSYEYDVTQAQYGGNLKRFLKKARDARSSSRYYKAPKIVMIGDSVTGGSWAEKFKTYLCNEYDIPLSNFTIHWYGGYRIQDYLSFIENTLIYPNPDLILFGEYEGFDSHEEELMVIEDVISLLRDRTTADIGIYTWSMSGADGTNYVNDKNYLKDSETYQDLNRYRDIAAVYNCEVIDVNEAIKYALDKGVSVNDIWGAGNTSVHLSSNGYEMIHLPEFKKHFKSSDNQTATNIPYPLPNKEEEIFLANANKMGLFNYKEKISLSGSWIQNNKHLISETVGDFVEIKMKDIFGFEILHGNQHNASVLLKKDGEAYKQPSEFKFNNRPLQYMTEILSTTYADNWDNWRLKRPFKKGIVTSNILANGVSVSGKYTIKVISVVGNTVTCEMFDPSSVSLGTFVVGQDATFVAGNLEFPKVYNGEDNFYAYPSYPFFVNDEYEFYIKNNWCDRLGGGEGWDKVIGLERGDYTVKFTIDNVLGAHLYKIKLLH